VVQPPAPAPKGNGGGASGGPAAKIDKLEKAVEKLTDMVEKLAKSKGKGKEESRDEGAVQEVAKITVTLPANATLYVDNVLCPLTSATRTFATPKLQSGQKYYYTRIITRCGSRPRSMASRSIAARKWSSRPVNTFR
jgi:uncharacterized protein (TIGR03000 family)